MDSKFTFVELFAGIGGVSFGLERVGGKCLLAAEYDPEREGKKQFAQESYKMLHPNTPVTGDVFKLEAKDVPDHDLLSFTSPCQSFSNAGKGLGFDDIRGTVTFEALRIAKEKQPKMLFMENVKGLLSNDKGKTIETIIRAMSECGYTIDFNILNSKYFGVPQNRERVFLFGIRNDLIKEEAWIIEGNNVLTKTKKKLSASEGIKTFNFDWPEQTEVVTRLRDVLEDEVDKKYYLSEEKTAKLVEQLIKESHLKQVGYIEKKMQGNNVYDLEVINPTITSDGGGKASLSDKHNFDHIAEEVRPTLTPDRINKRQNGRRFKDDDEESFTLTSQDRHGVSIGNYPKYRIRKLTPKECFRLQGFSDESYQKLVDAGVSHSQIYKQAGNAVTVNVIEAIGKKLIKYL